MSNVDVPFETTLHVRDACLCLHTQRAARRLARLFDDALRPVGLTSGQFSLLNALNRPEPPSIGQVARLLAMDRTTLTAALKPLERNGFVTVTPDPRDGRNRLLRLTGAGRQVLASAVLLWRNLHEAIEADLLQVKPDELRSALNGLAQSRTTAPSSPR